MNWKGTYTALVTPLRKGEVDIEKFRELVELQIAAGVDGVVPCGTTGESATLSHAEHRNLIKEAVKTAAGRVKVLAGTGSNSTEEAVELTAFAAKVKADAALLITPYYNRPTQAGLEAHFAAVAEACKIPLVLYNVPSRTGVNLLPDTVARLAKRFPSVQAVKEACGNLDQVTELCQIPKLDVLSGDDSLTLPMMAVGATGVISVVSNLVPADMARLTQAFLDGRLDEARRLHHKLYPLIKACFLEVNPLPVKTAMGLMRMLEPGFRLPLCPMREDNVRALTKSLARHGLL